MGALARRSCRRAGDWKLALSVQQGLQHQLCRISIILREVREIKVYGSFLGCCNQCRDDRQRALALRATVVGNSKSRHVTDLTLPKLHVLQKTVQNQQQRLRLALRCLVVPSPNITEPCGIWDTSPLRRGFVPLFRLRRWLSAARLRTLRRFTAGTCASVRATCLQSFVNVLIQPVDYIMQQNVHRIA